MTFDLNMVLYLLGVAASAGAIIARISALEKKVERLNKAADRALRLEEWRDGVERRLEHIERGSIHAR